MQIFLKEDNRHPKRKITVLTILKFMMGNSLEVQWLGLHAFSVVAWVQSLVREVRCYNLHSMAKNNNKIHDGCPKKRHQKQTSGTPWWFSGKDFAFQCKRHQYDPWSRKIPHAAEQQSLCAPTLEPVLWSPGTTTTGPRSHNYWSLHTLEPTLSNKKSHVKEKPMHLH